MHAKRWGEETWRRKMKGTMTMLKACWLVYRGCRLFQLFPLYSLLSSIFWALSLRLCLSLSTGFSSFVPLVLQILFVENGAKAERQSLLALAFDDLSFSLFLSNLLLLPLLCSLFYLYMFFFLPLFLCLVLPASLLFLFSLFFSFFSSPFRSVEEVYIYIAYT